MRTEAEVAAMSCPVCRVPLALSDRLGIEIDYCPQCRGAWLDRGELDKIIERSLPQAEVARADAQPLYEPFHTGGGYGRGGKARKRRKNWLEDIFD